MSKAKWGRMQNKLKIIPSAIQNLRMSIRRTLKVHQNLQSAHTTIYFMESSGGWMRPLGGGGFPTCKPTFTSSLGRRICRSQKEQEHGNTKSIADSPFETHSPVEGHENVLLEDPEPQLFLGTSPWSTHPWPQDSREKIELDETWSDPDIAAVVVKNGGI